MPPMFPARAHPAGDAPAHVGRQREHEVLRAQYDEPAGKWRLRVRRPSPDGSGAAEEFDDSADVLVTAVGSLSRWKWPDIDGLHDFKGELYHSAGFDAEGQSTWQEAWKDKKVGIIGVVSLRAAVESNSATDGWVCRARARCSWCPRSSRVSRRS